MKETINIIRSRWREYLLEVLVIILGLLLAFALNNWNDLRIQRIEEQKILSVLHQEFEGNLKALNSILESHDISINLLLDAVRKLENQNNEKSSELIEAIKMAFHGKTYNPMFGVMNSLLNSDHINLIENEELKYSLARFPGMIDDYLEEEEFILRIIFDIVIPELLNLDPESTKIDNLIIKNSIPLVIQNVSGATDEGVELRTEMIRISSLIKKERN